MVKHKLLLVDDDADHLLATREFLERRGYVVDTVSSGEQAIARVKRAPRAYAVVVVDYQMGSLDGAMTTRALKEINPDLFILILSGASDKKAFLLPSRNGATAFVDKSEEDSVLLSELARLCQRYDAEQNPVSSSSSTGESERLITSIGLVGRSKELAKVAEHIIRLREKDGPVLLLGESGTGKERLARALRRDGSEEFVARNCADFSIAKEMARSELFGHVRGAFTNAVKDTKGAFEAAGRGTMFLDELHELDRDVQAALLRVLEGRTVTPVGSQEEIPIHCRFIAGAKPDLLARVKGGFFKEDLFHRLSENVVRVPRLSERPDDVAPLVAHFCTAWSDENGEEKTFLANTIPLLESLPWPGNVRELRNVVYAVLNGLDKRYASVADIQAVLADRAIGDGDPKERWSSMGRHIDAVREGALLRALEQSRSIREAARKLDLAPSTLTRFLKRKNIAPEDILARRRVGEGNEAE